MPLVLIFMKCTGLSASLHKRNENREGRGLGLIRMTSYNPVRGMRLPKFPKIWMVVVGKSFEYDVYCMIKPIKRFTNCQYQSSTSWAVHGG